MNDRYYKQGIQFIMRDFVSKLIGKYIEYLGESNPDKVEQAQAIFQDFQLWLYQLTEA